MRWTWWKADPPVRRPAWLPAPQAEPVGLFPRLLAALREPVEEPEFRLCARCGIYIRTRSVGIYNNPPQVIVWRKGAPYHGGCV